MAENSLHRGTREYSAMEIMEKVGSVSGEQLVILCGSCISRVVGGARYGERSLEPL